jgi:hypothetical protein
VGNSTVAETSTPMLEPGRTGQSLVGTSLLLVACANSLALGGFWIVHSTYAEYRHRTDLDMPDWFVINMGLSFKVYCVVALAGLLNMLAVILFYQYVPRVGWLLQIGFLGQWLTSFGLLMLLWYAGMP